ncbi:MAG TPA: hypothetical protein VM821_06585, partial [Abditibacteriaceae bacterium]|nr:hypothetical protein [Abditibacteriaceae bacterium]
MSTSAPQLVPQTARLRRARLWPLLWLIPIGISCSIISGALMNAVNGWLSPSYFSMFSYAGDPSSFDGWISIVQRGILEGTFHGAIFTVIYTAVVIFVSRGNCPFGVALRGLFRVIVLVGLTSLFFGLNAIFLALIMPTW